MRTIIEVKDKNQTDQLIKVSPFRPEIRKTNPHKHNGYFEIIYLSQGGGTHYIDHNPYPIKPPTVFTINKEQVHHWDMTLLPAGYVLLLKKEFVDKSLDKELKRLLTTMSKQPTISLQDSSVIDKIFEALTAENSFTVTEGLLKALLAKIIDSTISKLQRLTSNQNLYLQFRELLSEHGAITTQVAHYANLLHTSPQNLNASCQKTNNQTASEVIAESIISEAKRLLIYTDQTVTQIAHTLGFVDTSHFVKYFKRYTAKTPVTFRRTLNLNPLNQPV
jgi:AraC-like DNA-binding protein